MKVKHQVWEKLPDGSMKLLVDEMIDVPNPEPSIEDRVKALETWVKTLSSP